jgi:mannose-6-phosphate isomerase-like protein (cupin superfamily)
MWKAAASAYEIGDDAFEVGPGDSFVIPSNCRARLPVPCRPGA